MEELIENAELLAFTRAVDTNSLSRAAAELGVPRATLGRRLQRLEARLGVRLLRRTTRSLALTDAGEVLYRQARIALDAVRQAEASVRRDDPTPRGDLRLSAPPFHSPGFYRMLEGFARRYPEVRVSAHFSLQQVDLLRSGYDVAIRGASTLEPGLIARQLASSRMIAVAAPSYLAGAPPLRTLADLRRYRCLLGFVRGELPQTHWLDGRGRKVQVEGALASNDIAFLRQAALSGQGVAYLPERMLSAHLAAGRLVQVLPSLMQGESRMAIVYAEREYLPTQVRAFVDAVVAWAAREGDELWPQDVAMRAGLRTLRGARRQR